MNHAAARTTRSPSMQRVVFAARVDGAMLPA
jgi:hypothetical protein